MQKELDDRLLKRSENLGIKPEILLDLEVREKWILTIKSLITTINLFVFAYIVKTYISYKFTIYITNHVTKIVLSLITPKINKNFGIANNLID